MNLYSGLATFGRIREYLLAIILIIISVIVGIGGVRKLGDDKTRKDGEKTLAISMCLIITSLFGIYMVRRFKPAAAIVGAQGIFNIAKVL